MQLVVHLSTANVQYCEDEPDGWENTVETCIAPGRRPSIMLFDEYRDAEDGEYLLLD